MTRHKKSRSGIGLRDAAPCVGGRAVAAGRTEAPNREDDHIIRKLDGTIRERNT